MEIVITDGGRSSAGYKGEVGDCVVRSVAIASDRPYKDTYKIFQSYMKGYGSPRNGVPKKIAKKVIEDLGGRWTSTMKIGSGCRTHLVSDELPFGKLVVVCSKHYTAVIDGVIHDNHDPSRGGTRCVYGYWKF